MSAEYTNKVVVDGSHSFNACSPALGNKIHRRKNPEQFKADTAMAEHRDEEAKFLRKLADEYKALATKLRVGYDNNLKAHEAEHGRGT